MAEENQPPSDAQPTRFIERSDPLDERRALLEAARGARNVVMYELPRPVKTLAGPNTLVSPPPSPAIRTLRPPVVVSVEEREPEEVAMMPASPMPAPMSPMAPVSPVAHASQQPASDEVDVEEEEEEPPSSDEDSEPEPQRAAPPMPVPRGSQAKAGKPWHTGTIVSSMIATLLGGVVWFVQDTKEVTPNAAAAAASPATVAAAAAVAATATTAAQAPAQQAAPAPAQGTTATAQQAGMPASPAPAAPQAAAPVTVAPQAAVPAEPTPAPQAQVAPGGAVLFPAAGQAAAASPAAPVAAAAGQVAPGQVAPGQVAPGPTVAGTAPPAAAPMATSPWAAPPAPKGVSTPRARSRSGGSRAGVRAQRQLPTSGDLRPSDAVTSVFVPGSGGMRFGDVERAEDELSEKLRER
jgi:hypothetical protein